MVAGFCKGPYCAPESLVAHVCLVCDGLAGHDQSGEQALTDPRPKGKGFTPSSGVQTSGPLGAGPGERDGERAATRQNPLWCAMPSREAQIRGHFGKCVLTPGCSYALSVF